MIDIVQKITHSTKKGDISINNTTADFKATYEDYTVKGTVDLDIQSCDEECFLEGIYFYCVEVIYKDGTKINLQKIHMQNIEFDVESYFKNKVAEL